LLGLENKADDTQEETLERSRGRRVAERCVEDTQKDGEQGCLESPVELVGQTIIPRAGSPVGHLQGHLELVSSKETVAIGPFRKSSRRRGEAAGEGLQDNLLRGLVDIGAQAKETLWGVRAVKAPHIVKSHIHTERSAEVGCSGVIGHLAVGAMEATHHSGGPGGADLLVEVVGRAVTEHVIQDLGSLRRAPRQPLPSVGGSSDCRRNRRKQGRVVVRLPCMKKPVACCCRSGVRSNCILLANAPVFTKHLPAAGPDGLFHGVPPFDNTVITGEEDTLGEGEDEGGQLISSLRHVEEEEWEALHTLAPRVVGRTRGDQECHRKVVRDDARRREDGTGGVEAV
jgi:hypothetical protein